MPVYKKIKNNPSLVRDSKSRAILNTSSDEYLVAKQRRNRVLREKKEIQQLKSEVSELKSMLQQLINNQNA